MPIKDNWGREVVDVVLLDLFISLMLSDIYRLWPAKLHIRSPINIFVAQGTVEQIAAGTREYCQFPMLQLCIALPMQGKI